MACPGPMPPLDPMPTCCASWSSPPGVVLVSPLRRCRAPIRAAVVRRRRDVFLFDCRPGCLGFSLAQHFWSSGGLPRLPGARRGLCRSDGEPERRHCCLRIFVFCGADPWARCNVCVRSLQRPHLLQLRMFLDWPVSARWCSVSQPKCGLGMPYSGRLLRFAITPVEELAERRWCLAFCSRSSSPMKAQLFLR